MSGAGGDADDIGLLDRDELRRAQAERSDREAQEYDRVYLFHAGHDVRGNADAARAEQPLSRNALEDQMQLGCGRALVERPSELAVDRGGRRGAALGPLERRAWSLDRLGGWLEAPLHETVPLLANAARSAISGIQLIIRRHRKLGLREQNR